MSVSKKTAAMILANKKREEVASKTYTVERLLKRRKRKVTIANVFPFTSLFVQGRTEYLVKWKHWDRTHNSWEPEGNILDQSLIESYRRRSQPTARRSSSPRKSQRNSTDPVLPDKPEPPAERDEQPMEKDVNNSGDDEKTIRSAPIDYWYPPICNQKSKFTVTDITSDNITITFRELV